MTLTRKLKSLLETLPMVVVAQMKTFPYFMTVFPLQELKSIMKDFDLSKFPDLDDIHELTIYHLRITRK